MRFLYHEITVAKTKDGEEYSTSRQFGKDAEKIDNPFDYMFSLGLSGWEMVGMSTIQIHEGVARVYVFKFLMETGKEKK